MIRRWFVPQPRPTLLLVLFALAAAAPAARSQEATTQERLDRLERDLSMLQRQVYRGGVSGSADAPATGNLAADTQIRMDRLEQEMRDLTGKVEGETNEVQQLRQRLEQINSDIDVRLGHTGQGGGRATAAAPPPHRGPRHADTLPPPGLAGEPPNQYRDGPPPYAADDGKAPPEPAMPGDSGLGPGTLTPPGVPAPPTRLTPPPAGAIEGSHPHGRRNLPSSSVAAQYNSAFGLLRQADYAAAEDALRSFVRQHPDSALAGNAQYWLGESYYARGKYADAAIAFAAGYKHYPTGAKAADDLFKLAMALDRADQRQNACVALGQLDHAFPHAGNALRQRATAEKKRLGC